MTCPKFQRHIGYEQDSTPTVYALVVSRELGRIFIAFYIGSIERLFSILVLKVIKCAVVEGKKPGRCCRDDDVSQVLSPPAMTRNVIAPGPTHRNMTIIYAHALCTDRNAFGAIQVRHSHSICRSSYLKAARLTANSTLASSFVRDFEAS